MRPELSKGRFPRDVGPEVVRVDIGFGRNRVVFDHFPEAGDAVLSVDTLR